MPPKKRAGYSPPKGSDESDVEDDPPTPKKEVRKVPTKKAPVSDVQNEDKENADGNRMEVDDDEDILHMEIPPKPMDFTRDESSDRLMIYKIEVTNFKSYYGTKIIGPFHKNFTSIIGPNGSGKSNVIDSLLFVFGYRSTKIRSKKISNLIHNSAGRKCDSATVAIAFQRIIDRDANNFTVLPNSRFTISRTAYHNNSSTYAIDGKNRSYKEVEARLREVEIDLTHNRFLILQGEVEAISMMKPKGVNVGEEGMLEYLEDIIGSNRFTEPIARFEKRLDKLSAELSQQKIRKETARTEKDALTEGVRETVSFLNQENEMTRLKSTVMQVQRLKISDMMAPLEEELKAKKDEFTQVTTKQKENQTGSKEHEKADKELAKEKATALEELDKAKQAVEDAQTSETRRKNNVKRITGDVGKMEAEMDKEKKKKEALLSVPEKATKKIEKLKTEAEELKEKETEANRAADENLAEFEEKSKTFQGEKTEAEKEFSSKNEILNELKGKVTVADAELKDLRKLANKDKNKLEDLEKSLQDANEKFDRESKELEEINDKLPNEENEYKNLMPEPARLKQEEGRLREEVRTLRGRLDADRTAQQNIASGSKALSILMKGKKDGLFPKFLGRLGDLGAIDKKYDIAISTNCAFLDNFLCETADQSQACIDHFSQNKIGRATFMSLDKLNYNEQRMNANPSSFPASRLFDLIQCDPAYRGAFYFALGDMLVVDNLKLAQQIDNQHRGRFVVVSLNGDRVNSDGSICGGGNPVRGRIGSELKAQPSADHEAKMREMAKAVEEKTKQHEELVGRMREIDKRVFELRNSLNQLKERKRQLEMSIQVTSEKLAVLERTIAATRSQAEKSRVDENEIANRQKALEEFIHQRDEAAQRANSSKQKVDEIAARIDAVFNELVQKFKTEATDARERRVSIEKTIAKESAAINNSERNIAKVEERIVQLEKDVAKKTKELDRLNEAEADEEQLVEQKKTVKEMEENMKSFEERFKTLRDKKLDLDKEEVELEKSRKSLEEQVAHAKHEITRSKKGIEEVEGKMSALKMNKVPKLAFLTLETMKPEHMKMELDENFDAGQLADLPPDELEKVTKGLINEYTDRVYTLEYEMRANRANEPEPIDEIVADEDAIPVLKDEELRAITPERLNDIDFEIKNIERKLAAQRKNVNVGIIEEYIDKTKKYNVETMKTKNILDNYNAHRLKCLLFKKLRLEEFVNGFACITNSVREMYQMITLGGDACLDFKSGADPFSEGIQFLVRPPKKSWKIIENLSGGEKTLASLSLVFALHHFRPTPFYVMDEIDAALDFRNVSIIGHYIKERTKNAQFIIITLRNNMFELANRLIGIYKVDDCTDNVAIDPMSICLEAKAIAKRMGIIMATLPDEVTKEYLKSKNEQRQENTANERLYEHFPSSKDIEKAERIVQIETKLKKEIAKTGEGRAQAAGSGSSSRIVTERAVSESRSGANSVNTNRPESRIMIDRMKMPNVRLVPSEITRPEQPPSSQERLSPEPMEQDAAESPSVTKSADVSGDDTPSKQRKRKHRKDDDN